MGVDDHTRRRETDGRHDHPSSDSHARKLRASKDKKDANNIFVIVVHLTYCNVKVPQHREDKYVALEVRTTRTSSHQQ
jgi:hypothetical protein